MGKVEQLGSIDWVLWIIRQSTLLLRISQNLQTIHFLLISNLAISLWTEFWQLCDRKDFTCLMLRVNIPCLRQNMFRQIKIRGQLRKNGFPEYQIMQIDFFDSVTDIYFRPQSYSRIFKKIDIAWAVRLSSRIL